MKAHTNKFKQEIAKMGRQISAIVSLFVNTDVVTQNNYNITTESGDKLVTEIDQTPGDQALAPVIPILAEDIYSIVLIKNGNLLQSLMKQCNIELSSELSIGSVFNVQLGILVNNTYEYIDYGNFVIYSKTYNAENDTWQYVAYDEMLFTMKNYTRLNITYPITVREYVTAIADKLGFNFYNKNTEFVNYDKLIYKDYFVGKDTTYRDILDKLAEITASNILINSNINFRKASLYIKYPTETNDIIDESYLKDINVNFSEKFGPINKIEARDKENDLLYITKDDTSINANGETKITLTNNPFIFNGEENEICDNILNKLKDLSYTINDFTTTGVCYYDFLDLFTVTINEENYTCLLLNNEINITQGIEETIFTEKIKNTETETDNYKSTDTQSQAIMSEDNNVLKNNVVNAINLSPEKNIIRTNKILLILTTTATTDSNGFITTNLNSDYVICSATASFNNNNYGFITPYYYYNNGKPIWKLKVESETRIALASTQINVTIYYFRKDSGL